MRSLCNSFSFSAKRFCLVWVVLAQLLTPLTVSAAMHSATQGSPYYCGQLSAPVLSQLRTMDLPAELLRQVLPEQYAEHCHACVLAQPDDAVLPALPAAVIPGVDADRVAALPALHALTTRQQSFQARAPPL